LFNSITITMEVHTKESPGADYFATPATHDQVRLFTTGLVVNVTGDEGDADLGDGIADMDLTRWGAQTTLRSAMEFANAKAGKDFVWFEIPGSGVAVITPRSALPTIAEPVEVDALAYDPSGPLKAKVRLEGANGTFDGLRVAAGGSVVRGLTITGFGAQGQTAQGHGIVLQNSGGNLVEANLIGTDGTADLGNAGDGVRLEGCQATQSGATRSRATEGTACRSSAARRRGTLSWGTGSARTRTVPSPWATRGRV
jgi:hypothetical protein